MSIHADAERFGIPRPELEHQEKIDKYGTTIVSLTMESEVKWAEYLRAVTLAKIALTPLVEQV